MLQLADINSLLLTNPLLLNANLLAQDVLHQMSECYRDKHAHFSIQLLVFYNIS